MDKFLVLVSLPGKMWQQILDHMVALEHFVPRVRAKICFLQLQLNLYWSAVKDNPPTPVPPFGEHQFCLRRWLQ